MAMKGSSVSPKIPVSLEPHHQKIWCHIRTLIGGGLTPLQRCSRCILQPQPTRQILLNVIKLTLSKIKWFFFSFLQFLILLTSGEQWQWRGAPYSPKSQHYWDLTIRLFSVISGHSWGVLSSAEVQSVYSTAPVDRASDFWTWIWEILKMALELAEGDLKGTDWLDGWK